MKCIAGCKVYTGNETRHHKDCPFYPESFSKRFDLMKASHTKLVEALANLINDHPAGLLPEKASILLDAKKALKEAEKI